MALLGTVYRNIADSYALPVRRVAENLRLLRREAGLTQQQLAQLAQVKQGDISKWEKDKAIPTVTSLLKLAAGLKRPVDALLTGLEPSYDSMRVAEDFVAGPTHDHEQLGHDLPRHTSSKSSAPHHGGALDPATARILTDDHLNTLNDIVVAAKAIVELGEQIEHHGETIVREKDASARRRAAARSQNPRKRRRPIAS